MKIYTPEGKREVPDCMANDYKSMSDIELIGTLLEQNKRFLDPVLVSICIDKGLLKKGEAVEDLEMKLDYMKIQEYDNMLKENLHLKQQLKEKDEEIENNKKRLKDLKFLKSVFGDIEDFRFEFEKMLDENADLQERLKSTTKQVCEKIRKVYPKDEYGFDYVIMHTKLMKLLDQIEKGEKDDELCDDK